MFRMFNMYNVVSDAQRYCAAEEFPGKPGHYLVSLRSLDALISDYYFEDPVRIKKLLADAHILQQNKDGYEFPFIVNGETRYYCILAGSTSRTTPRLRLNYAESHIPTISSDGKFSYRAPEPEE